MAYKASFVASILQTFCALLKKVIFHAKHSPQALCIKECLLPILFFCSFSINYGQNIDVTYPGYGTVTGSLSHSYYTPDKAFDDQFSDNSDGSRWLVPQSSLPNVFVKYQFPNGKKPKVIEYRIKSQHYSPNNRSPKSFELQGSNDDSNWTTLDSESNQTNWGADQWKSFSIDSPGEFEYYKLKISEASGIDDYVGIREIELLTPFDFNNSSALTIAENQPVGSVVGQLQTFHGNPLNYSIPTTAHERLRAWWKFDETSGTTAYDFSGNGKHATLKKWCSAISNGVMGKALSLDGSNDYVLTPLKGINNSDFTWSLWVKTLDNDGSLLGESSGNWGTGHKAFYLNGGRLKVEAKNATSYHHNTNIADGSWHHVAFMVGNSGNNDPYSLYLDGSKVRSSNFNWFRYSSSGKNVKIGQFASNSSNYLKAFYDDIRIYSKRLSSAEISSIYGNGSGDLTVNNLFSIDLNGTIRTKKIFDFESDASTYELPIFAKLGSSSLEKQFSISLTNVIEDLDMDGTEDALDLDADGDGLSNAIEIASGSDPMDATSFNQKPTDILKSSALNVNENHPAGTIISTFSGTDPDANTTLSYSLKNNTWRVSHLTGDSTSGISSSYEYTCAVNVHGSSDKIVNGVTFWAETGTSAQGWQITQGFHKGHNSQNSSVTGKIGEVLDDRLKYDGSLQKLQLNGLTPGQSYRFSYFGQAWDLGSNKEMTITCSANGETLNTNSNAFVNEAQDGILIECSYLATSSDVVFTLTGTNLYGFSNRVLDDDNYLFSIDENGTLRTITELDRERKASRAITVVVSDEWNATYEKEFTVTVGNVVEDLDGDGIEDALDDDQDGDGISNANEIFLGSDPKDINSTNQAPIGINATQALAIPEDTTTGTIINHFTGTDSDAGDALTFSLIPKVPSKLNPAWLMQVTLVPLKYGVVASENGRTKRQQPAPYPTEHW